MKRRICSAGALAALSLFFCAPNLQANLLVNGGFEIMPGSEGFGWNLLGGADVIQTSGLSGLQINTPELTGRYSLGLREDQLGPLIAAQQTLAAQPGQVWTLSGLVIQHGNNATTPGTYGQATMEFLGADGAIVATDKLAALVTSDWREFSLTAEAPAGTTGVLITAKVVPVYSESSLTKSPINFDNMEATISSVPEVPPGWFAFLVSVAAAGVATFRKRSLTA